MHQQLSKATLSFLEQPKQLLIHNEWMDAESGATFETINPANGTAISQIALADKSDIDQAVNSARKAFQEVWSGYNPMKRGQLLLRLADLMERDLRILQELETLDNGKPIDKAKYDVLGAIKHFRYYAGWASKIEGTQIPVGEDQLVYTRREALGVVALIVPWNFPLMIAVWKLAPALACGNCCILKPAEQTPLTALYLGQLIIEAGFPAGVVNIVTGRDYLPGML